MSPLWRSRGKGLHRYAPAWMLSQEIAAVLFFKNALWRWLKYLFSYLLSRSGLKAIPLQVNPFPHASQSSVVRDQAKSDCALRILFLELKTSSCSFGRRHPPDEDLINRRSSIQCWKGEHVGARPCQSEAEEHYDQIRRGRGKGFFMKSTTSCKQSISSSSAVYPLTLITNFAEALCK